MTLPASGATATPQRGVSATWIAFLVMAFVIVGLTGLFATYAVPLPLDRALARDAALDDALSAARGADPQAALESLRPRLGESADALLPPAGDFAAQVAKERAAMHARLRLEAEVITTRIRWLICVITAMAAAFGVALLHVGRRG